MEGHTESPKNKEETISAAAIEYEGEIFRGRNHAEAIMEMEMKIPDYEPNKVRDGFVTSTGRYVERDEALEIAKRQGQTKPSALPDMLDVNHVDYK